MNKFEVFISHAVEDKCAIANELNLRLKEMGIKAWYSGDELTIGDSIMSSVNQAIKTVQYGVVILSPLYLRKRWTMLELQALMAREHMSIKRIFPIWHGVGYEEVLEYLPIMADRYAIPSEKGVEFIVNSLAIAMNKPLIPDFTARSRKPEPIMQIGYRREKPARVIADKHLTITPSPISLHSIC